MNKKQLTDFYKTCANLYGAIYSDEAFDILKKFFPDFLKRDFIEDLKQRFGVRHKGYKIIKISSKYKYFITHEYCNSGDIDCILEDGKGIPYFIPSDNFEEFIKYSDLKVSAAEEHRAISIYKRNLDKLVPSYTDEQKEQLITMIFMYDYTKHYLDDLIFLIDEGKLPEIPEDKFADLTNFVDDIYNNKRLFENRGHTINEISEMMGPYDPVAVITTFIKEGIRQGLLDHEGIEEFVNSLDMEADIKEKIIQNFVGQDDKISA